MPVEVENEGEGGPRLSAAEQAELRKIAAALRDRPRKKKALRQQSSVVVFAMDADAGEAELEEERETKKKSATERRLQTDRKSTRLNSSHSRASRMPSSA